MFSQYLILVILCCLQPSVIRGSRILAIIPTHSYSHQVNFRPIMIELARLGHDLIVITTDPINDSTIKNYTEINIGHLITRIQDIDFVSLRFNMSWFDHTEMLYDYSYNVCDKILNYPPVKKLYSPPTKQKFDVILLELLWFHSFLGLSHIFDCPTIGLTSLGLFHSVDDILGLPTLESYPSNWEMGNSTGDHLPLWHRISNFLTRTYNLYKYKNILLPTQDKILRKYLGNDVPNVEKLVKNISLVLVNHHEVLQYPKVAIGKVISIGGLYTSLNLTQIVPPKLQKIMDDATNGFIYVSFGSNIQSRNMRPYLKKILIDTFSNLPHQVIWKYEDNSMQSLSSNIYLSKWLPQRMVLNHPNIKLFIYQGGLQSTEEAIMSAVPMVGVPFMSDQDSVVMRMVSIGVARSIEITRLENSNQFDEVIKDVLYNKSYKENALKAQKCFKDRPIDGLRQATWWIEYVIRHRGAPYHYFSVADDPTFSRYNEDVIAVLAIFTFVIACLTVVTLFKLCNWCRRMLLATPRSSNEKLKSN